jgi:hypothetical protein
MERQEAETLQALLSGRDTEAPDASPVFDERIETEYKCPKCHYQWSGKLSKRDRSVRKADGR